MTQEEKLIFQGKILESSKGIFRVELENGHEIRGHLSGKMKKYTIRVLIGDEVTVELSPYDLTKGRIISRKKIEGKKVNLTKKELKHRQFKK